MKTIFSWNGIAFLLLSNQDKLKSARVYAIRVVASSFRVLCRLRRGQGARAWNPFNYCIMQYAALRRQIRCLKFWFSRVVLDTFSRWSNAFRIQPRDLIWWRYRNMYMIHEYAYIHKSVDVLVDFNCNFY